MFAYLADQIDAFKAWRRQRFLANVLRGLSVRRDWSVHHWVEISKGWF